MGNRVVNVFIVNLLRAVARRQVLLLFGKPIETEVFVVFVFHLCSEHIDLLVRVVILRGVRCFAFVIPMLVKHCSSFVVSGTLTEVNSPLSQFSFGHRGPSSLKTTRD